MPSDEPKVEIELPPEFAAIEPAATEPPPEIVAAPEPKVEDPKEPEPEPVKVEPPVSEYDPQCKAQLYHRMWCSCKGAARNPF